MGAKVNYKKGELINGLIFIDDVEPHILPNGRKIRKSLFKCSCGNEFEFVMMSVKKGRTKSCGCKKNKLISEKTKKNMAIGTIDCIKYG